MRSKPRDATATPLTRAQSEDVLRYWLAALRLEEALQARPQARRAPNAFEPPRLDMPAPGQDYFKVALTPELGGLLAEDTPLVQRMDGELARFFESWLHRQYRRGADDGELSHLLCFPVVHLPRGELAGLLRAGVVLRFDKHEGAPFQVPSWAERQRGQYPDPPDQVRVKSAARAEGAWPFFVDTRLLHHPLGVPSESIDAFFEALRARETVSPEAMLALVVALLEGVASPQPSEDAATLERLAAASAQLRVDELLARLTAAVRTLLQQATSRAQVYPVGIVVDASQAKTTWHLQRELSALLDSESDDDWSPESALGCYLEGRAQPIGQGVQRALFDGPPLTERQRSAANEFWGSVLSAVQGPPGTGKTTLILHLCAEALVRQMDVLLDTGTVADAPFVIASSNNRAVDNVIDPLTRGEGLPLALRVGNRQVCEQTLSAQLSRTLSFLQAAEREPSPVHGAALAEASEDYKRVRAEMDRQLAPREEAQRYETEHARLSAELAKALNAAESKRALGEGRAADALAPHAQALLEAIAPLEKRLVALSKLCEAKPGLMQVNAVARHYGRTAANELPRLEALLTCANLTLELALPPLVASPAVSELMEAWEEGTELSLTRLTELRERVESVHAAQTLASEIARLQRELAALGPVRGALPELHIPEELARALFRTAIKLREAWAKANAQTLRIAVEAALRVVKEERSLRPLFRSDPKSATLLRRLFGVWGSTLLSLGNCFPPEAGSTAHVVIDEAGQCHPAHAVSALLRARSALVLGDVHQLAPVVELGADDEARLLQSCRLRTPAKLLTPYRVHNEAWSSAQTLADRAVATPRRLVDHFRCQHEIIAISDALCDYGLTVHTPRVQRSGELPFLRHPLMLVDVKGRQERMAASLHNELELQQTLRLVSAILRAGVATTDLAVITPYRGQLERLRRAFADQRIAMEYSGELAEEDGARTRISHGVALGTVHRFQGGERSIVLFSSVISRPSNLTFLNARPNLLNVAVSRAQHHFVCIGHREVLAQGPKTRLVVEGAWGLANDEYA